jgi:hypothetical protein
MALPLSIEKRIRNDPSYTGGWERVSGSGAFNVPSYVSEQEVRDVKDWLAKRGGVEAETDLLKKQAYYYGAPTTSTTTYMPFGKKPEMGKLATFQAPKRGQAPSFTMPEMAEIPKFEAPEWDEGKISSLTQKRAAPGIRQLRAGMREVASQRFSNPQERAKALRAAFAGQGEGIESVLAGAGQAAVDEYALEYANKYKTAGMNWQEAVAKVKQEYETGVIKSQKEFEEKARAIEQVYAADVQAEMQRVEDENAKISQEYQAAWDAYGNMGKTESTEGYGVQPYEEDYQSVMSKLRSPLSSSVKRSSLSMT